MKPPCTDKCSKKCTSKIEESARIEVNARYRNFDWESRGLFIKGLVKPRDVQTRTKPDAEEKRRNISYRYNLIINREKIEVCQTYFLTTLGYNPANNGHLHMVLSKAVHEQKDKRGTHQRVETIDKTTIREHIQTFNSTISHYRREHAPNRLYLPSDISVKLMYQMFMEQNPTLKVSLETYRKVVKDMNISFAHLGHEECELCAKYG